MSSYTSIMRVLCSRLQNIQRVCTTLCTTLTKNNLYTFQGRRIRVAVICVSCDHPALCKLAGFAEHSSKAHLCHVCKCKREAIGSAESLCGGKGCTCLSFL